METRQPPVDPTTGTAGAGGPKDPIGETKRPMRTPILESVYEN
jgi:hypothetical protein